ncbi:hypothetical protein BGW36DRAFT_390678 [Talaromyces proteolyticus]|uniref:HTH psq-type domain-containing protein n=1 Tax=Talaromyces proteolyticus TaxID=1131652 RepID=A0AAD4PTU1_9EURO|nr:uncharacterized protein BGW36DRAFT_390678 [Talaromyces proteolyticus]KAH8689311.1 hypothetical protein BGW36DRAFT_390678 [Talaromyces proteolyticus]
MPPNAAKNDSSYEGRLALAIDALTTTKIASVRHAAHVFDVSRTTFQERLKSLSERAKTCPNSQKLTPSEEKSLHD